MESLVQNLVTILAGDQRWVLGDRIQYTNRHVSWPSHAGDSRGKHLLTSGMSKSKVKQALAIVYAKSHLCKSSNYSHQQSATSHRYERIHPRPSLEGLVTLFCQEVLTQQLHQSCKK